MASVNQDRLQAEMCALVDKKLTAEKFKTLKDLLSGDHGIANERDLEEARSVSVVVKLLVKRNIIKIGERGGYKILIDTLNNSMDEVQLALKVEEYQRRIAEYAEIGRSGDHGCGPSERHNISNEEGRTTTATVSTLKLKGARVTKSRKVETVRINWKQGSFFGFGGDMSETYNLYYYKTSEDNIIPIFVHDSFTASDAFTIDRKFQYGTSDGLRGAVFFLVLHDKERFKPYQKRFLQGTEGTDVEQYLQQTMHWDISWLGGNHLHTFPL